ncbi:MAG: hypothetical protein QHH13_02900 [Melioribacter sp.]|uniref:RHS repeat domain-containing protein n=1 Tax=Rosettibacter primus TaxID=3111523 RepID=UPI00247E7435|nr:hypothetical protein [Melioribacter sp.]
MKKLTKIFLFLFFIFIPLISLTIIVQCGNTQNKNQTVKSNTVTPSKNKKEIIDQNTKELKKAKELKVKVRRRYAGFFGRNNAYPKNMVLVEELFFDEKGYRTKHIRYKSTGDIDLSYEFKYDENGNLLYMDTYDGYGNLKGRRESRYNESNHEVLRKFLDDRSSGELRTEFYYNETNKLIKTISYTKKGTIASEQQNEYDGEFLIRSVIKDGESNQISEITFEYDSDGYLIKEIQKGIQGNNVINYKYDSRGNLIEIKDNQTTREMKYDSNGNLIEDKLYLSDGSRQFRITFSYYNNGLQKEEIRYTNDERPAFIARYEYEFYN